jgi:hypothetical protein
MRGFEDYSSHLLMLTENLNNPLFVLITDS